MGTNTDPYQQAEREKKITRQILEVCAEFNQPVSFVTKSALIERDLDILQPMAEKNLVEVIISVTTLNKDLAKKMEPRAAAPMRRLKTIKTLADAGIPTGVLVAPIIPFLNDDQIEQILEACVDAGANYAGYVLLRLPFEVKDLFEQWLQQHFPLKAKRIMGRIIDSREGKAYDATFGQRMSGTGIYAQLIKKRFALATQRLAFRQRLQSLDCSLFKNPDEDKQLSLF
jgi:DNA repair photolyase